MQRFIEKELLDWKELTNRSPLIVRGARQVGKSYTIEKFGQSQFDNLVTINFEYQPEFIDSFESLDPQRIISRIELMTENDIIDGKTLLFLDAIQQSPQALKALRYFKEKRPGLHVIAAGSLLEFALNEEHFSFPVGRINYLYMQPLSFEEFIFNLGNLKLLSVLQNTTLQKPIDADVHQHTLSLLRDYMIIGGMPAVVQQYIETKSYLEAHRLQSALLESYRNDFGKYANKAQFKHLQRFFEKAPLIVGSVFKYVKIDSEARSRDLKIALAQLCQKGLINRVFHTSANGIPLHAEVNDSKFKLVFLDIGLMQNANRIDPKLILNEDIWKINKGALAEQLVGQELLAASNRYENTTLYFWEKAGNSSREVDYIVELGAQIVPLKVKAGKAGHLRSLKTFMEEKGSKYGIVVSQAPLSKKENLIYLPLYLIGQVKRIMNSIC